MQGVADDCVESPKRKGRGKSAQSLAIIDACVLLAARIAPCSVRAYGYQLFTRGLLPDMSKKSTDKLSTLLVYAREKGLLRWRDVVDDTRPAVAVRTWANPDEVIEQAVRSYRLDYWNDQPRRVEIWAEKSTIQGTIAPILREFTGVTFRVWRGFGSATKVHDVAMDTKCSDKPMVVLYLGDHDPSGRHMSDVDLPKRLQRYEGRLEELRRIALDDRDIGPDSPLLSFPVDEKRGDPRYAWFKEHHGRVCWELDALPPDQLRVRVRDAILGLIDQDAWDHCLRIESAQVESMLSFMGTWNQTMSTAKAAAGEPSISGQARKYPTSSDGGG